MAEEPGGAKVDTLPPGIGDDIPVKLRDGSVVVIRRWGFTKSLLIVKLFEGIWSQLLTVKLEKGGVEAVRTKIFELLGPSAIDFARLSLEPEDRHHLDGEPDFEDVIDVFNASWGLNVTEAVAKKFMALAGNVGKLFS